MRTAPGLVAPPWLTLAARAPRGSDFQPVAPHRTLLPRFKPSMIRPKRVVVSELALVRTFSERLARQLDDEHWCSARDEYTRDDDHPGWF